MKPEDHELTASITVRKEPSNFDEALEALKESDRVIQFLIVGGFVSDRKVQQARELARQFT